MSSYLLTLVIRCTQIGLGICLLLSSYPCISGTVELTNIRKKDEIKSPSLKTVKNKQELEKYARSITVKVLSGQNWGSGILIRRNKDVYSVLTNEHVLLFGQGKNYKVVTLDGKTYPAKLLTIKTLSNKDLGVLQFQSKKSYSIASLSSNIKPIEGESVVAAGFPFSEKLKGLILSWGQIAVVNPQSFSGGYQIGYTNSIQKGMSGGPLLNFKGELVGINGVHKYPLWGNPYVFLDGRSASLEEQKMMSQLSWAIPTQTFLQLAPQFTNQKISANPPKY